MCNGASERLPPSPVYLSMIHHSALSPQARCMMLARIIFISSVLAAILVVLLLAFVPRPTYKSATEGPSLALSFYVANPSPARAAPSAPRRRDQNITALIFRHDLSDGPYNASRIIGRLQGFMVPAAKGSASEHSVFDCMHVAFDTREYCGSVIVEARPRGGREELVVVGGTQAFAFAGGFAVLEKKKRTYQLKLMLTFPVSARRK